MKNDNLQKIIDIVHKLQEEVVANNISGGKIAGSIEAVSYTHLTLPTRAQV